MFHEGNRNKETGREWQKDIGKIWNTSNWNSYILLRCAECEYNIGEPTLSPSPSSLSLFIACTYNKSATDFVHNCTLRSLADSEKAESKAKQLKLAKHFALPANLFSHYIFLFSYFVSLTLSALFFSWSFFDILERSPFSPSPSPTARPQHRPLSPLLPF